MWRIIILTLFFKGCVDCFDCFVCAQFNQSEIMEDYCYDFRYQSCISRRTHLYFNAPLDVSRTEQHVYSQSDVTMVTQLQYNRLSGLLALIKSWTGPLQVRVMLLCAHAYQPYVIHTSRVLCCNVLMHTSHMVMLQFRHACPLLVSRGKTEPTQQLPSSELIFYDKNMLAFE